MAQLVTLAQLMSRVRTRSDMPVGSIVDDDELTDLINESARRLYAARVKLDRDAFAKRATLVLAPDNVALPSDLLKLLTVEAQVDGNNWVRLHRANLQDAAPGVGASVIYAQSQTYELEGSNPGMLWSLPSPPPYPTLRIRYVPDTWGKTAGGAAINVMTALTDTIEVGMGWDRLIILDAAIACCTKEESDPRALISERAKLEEELLSEADDRDSAQPRSVVDVKGWC